MVSDGRCVRVRPASHRSRSSGGGRPLRLQSFDDHFGQVSEESEETGFHRLGMVWDRAPDLAFGWPLSETHIHQVSVRTLNIFHMFRSASVDVQQSWAGWNPTTLFIHRQF